MLQKMWSLPGTILLGITVGVAMLVTTTYLVPTQYMHLKTDVPPPASLQELIDEASLVFTGEVGEVVARRTFYGYGVYGEELKASEVPSDTSGIPITEFELKVERLIKDDGIVASEEPIILAMGGDITPEMRELSLDTDYPFSYTGDSNLFLLTPNPDGKTYGFYYGPWSRLIVEDSVLKMSNGQKDLLPFTADEEPTTSLSANNKSITLEGFVEQVNKQDQTSSILYIPLVSSSENE